MRGTGQVSGTPRAELCACSHLRPGDGHEAGRRGRNPIPTALHPFQALLDHTAILTRNTCTVAGTEVTFEQLIEATPTQRMGSELLGVSTSRRLDSTVPIAPNTPCVHGERPHGGRAET